MAKNIYPKEGYGFARIDAVDYFFHSQNCFKFSAKTNPKNKSELIANCAGHSEESYPHMPAPKIGARLIVITYGDGQKGKAISKFALESQLWEIKKLIEQAPRYRLVNFVYINGKLSKDKKPTEPIWEGNNPEEARRQWVESYDSDSLTVRSSTVKTCIQLETKLFWTGGMEGNPTS